MNERSLHDAYCNCRLCEPEGEKRPYRTWQCDTCGSEFDHFTYGGPCVREGCDGSLHHKKPALARTGAIR